MTIPRILITLHLESDAIDVIVDEASYALTRQELKHLASVFSRASQAFPPEKNAPLTTYR